MMKFVHVTFSEDCTLNASGETHEFESDKTYELPLQKADRLMDGNLPIASYTGTYEVEDDEVSERFGSEADPTDLMEEDEVEESKSPQDFLDDRTVDEVREDVKDFTGEEGDVEFLEAALDNADRKGAQEAIEEQLEEIKE